MDVFHLPDPVTTQDLEQLLDVGRSMLSRIRSEDPTFPEPDLHSLPRKTRFSRRAIVYWLVTSGRAPEAALPAFDVLNLTAPITQRWQYHSGEFVQLPATLDTGLTQKTIEVHASRYTAIDSADDRVVTICVPVGDTGAPALTGHALSTKQLALLGYHTGGLRGAVAWIQPHNFVAREYGNLFGADVPDDPGRQCRLDLLSGAEVAQLIGHPLPYWEQGAVAKSAVATWQPRPLGETTPPVLPGTPPALASAMQLRQQCREVIDQIDRGERTAPPEIVDELAQLGNTLWDTTLSQFPWGTADDDNKPPTGWVLPIIEPQPSFAEPTPLLPPQPGSVDLFHGLEWLVQQPDLPSGMARVATSCYGYPDSIDVFTLDLTQIPATLRTSITRNLHPIDATETWLHDALAENLSSDEPDPPASVAWTADHHPHTHPALITGSQLRYHVPRSGFPLATPAAVHLLGIWTGNGNERRYCGFLVDRLGALTPLPLNPAPATLSNTAAELAATVLGIAEPLHLGNASKLWTAPVQLTRLTTALATTGHLELDWATLQKIVGPRPAGLGDRDLIAAVNNKTHCWPAL